MSNSSILKKFASTSILNILLSFFNITSTVVIVRFFGTAAYANYTIDLSIISMIALFTDIVPSSYSVYKVQDEPEFINSIAAASFLGSLLVAFFIYFIHFIGLFNDFSLFIFVYGFLLSIKHFLDIRLQSVGLVKKFFEIEAISAGIRLTLIGLGFYANFPARHVIWGSLAMATLSSQGIWFINNPTETKPFLKMLTPKPWQQILSNRQKYISYYFTIALKRARDNIMPFLAGIYFGSKEVTGAFFLAYRGLSFTLGNIRVIDGFLKHRPTLKMISSISIYKKALIALSFQAMCITTSIILMILSGVYSFEIFTIFILSTSVLPYTFYIIKRASAYSNYNIRAINLSLIIYILSFLMIVFMVKQFEQSNQLLFSAIIVVVDLISLSSIIYLLGHKHEINL